MEHNGLGQVTAVSLPNGMTTAYTYDNRNRMTKLDHKYGGRSWMGIPMRWMSAEASGV